MPSFDAILVDAGTGNLHSVQNALESLGFRILLTADPDKLSLPARVILPGVGAFGSFMDGLQSHRLIEPLKLAARRGDPFLGICVGMQALFETSQEMGIHAGLGLIPGRVQRFPDFAGLKVPHTGWNQLWQDKSSVLMQSIQNGSYAYFNHSYYCAPTDLATTLTHTDYGLNYSSSVQVDNIFGVQFHPEKSQRVGLTLLANFFKVT
ncbi:MAG TPA: imidazole glycerol phosphate synthase subunit HisH [Anaerolineaceae bacterium]